MGYENSKIYKLVCEDGHYYYGSTITSLNERLWHHKASARTMTSKLYNHINQIGWDKVKIELVETPSCANRKDLRVIENKHILSSRSDELCLNTLRSYTADEEKQQMEKERKERNKEHRKEVVHKYYEDHKNEINQRKKRYYEENKQYLTETHKEYIERHKEQIQLQRKQFYEQNKERLCKEKREKREENKEETIRKRREYREKNREHINRLKREASMRKKQGKNGTDIPTPL